MKNIEKYVEYTAELINLELPPEYLPAVVENLERIAVIAQLVIDFPLPPEIEPAPKFDPEKLGINMVTKTGRNGQDAHSTKL